MAKVKIKGAKKLLKKFEKAGKVPSVNRALRPLMTKAARMIASQAKNNVKGISKFVSKAIAVRSKTYKSDFNMVRIIGPRVYTGQKIKVGGSKNRAERDSQDVAIEAKAIEFGTDPEIPARPFMRTALASRKTAIIKILSQFGKEIEKQLKT